MAKVAQAVAGDLKSAVSDVRDDLKSAAQTAMSAASDPKAAAKSAVDKAGEGAKAVAKREELSPEKLLQCLAIVALQMWVMNANWTEADQAAWNPFANVSTLLPCVMTVVYLCMIFFGKRLMKDREPFQLTEAMVMYNLFQTILNAWWVVVVIQEVWNTNTSWTDAADHSPAGFRLGWLIWVHYNNKYIEMLDTLFMVLRKKNNQISFLHVYHHALILWAWFIVCRFGCGGASYFGGLANSAIHVCMYGYYLLALLKIQCPWKRHLTQAQLFQFCICMLQAFLTMYRREYKPLWVIWVQVFVMLNMIVLFSNFYLKSYKKATKDAVKKAD